MNYKKREREMEKELKEILKDKPTCNVQVLI